MTLLARLKTCFTAFKDKVSEWIWRDISQSNFPEKNDRYIFTERGGIRLNLENKDVEQEMRNQMATCNSYYKEQYNAQQHSAQHKESAL